MSEILLSDFNKVEFSRQILKNTQMSNFMTIRPVSADIFHADGHVENNNQSSQFYESAWELIQQWKVHLSYPEYEGSTFLQKGCDANLKPHSATLFIMTYQRPESSRTIVATSKTIYHSQRCYIPEGCHLQIRWWSYSEFRHGVVVERSKVS
jgi:hypothetical protein